MGFLGGPRDPVGHFSALRCLTLRVIPFALEEKDLDPLWRLQNTGWLILHLLSGPTTCTQYQSLVCLSVCLSRNYFCDPCEDYATNLCLWLYLGMCTYVGAKLIFLTIFILSCFETGLDCFQRAIASSSLKGPASQLWSTDDPVSTQELAWHIQAIA